MSRQFQQNRLALFDEVGIIKTKNHIKKLYRKVNKTIMDGFLEIVNDIYMDIYNEAIDMGFEGDIKALDEMWIEEFFNEYNPVTKYRFSNEMTRKEQRLFESLVANREDKVRSYKTAENLLKRQIKQYSIELEDAVMMEVFKDLDVKKVMWNAEDDHKTCSVCRELDGKIFSIKDAPGKQHYHCRCFYTPVME